jgi:arylsulfatase A
MKRTLSMNIPRSLALVGTGASLIVIVCEAFAATASEAAVPSSDKPNIIVIVADDLGYGDVRCMDPQHAKVPTPNVDRLAREGILFTDAHAGAALCSPSRYSLLTGRFCWSSPLREHVVRIYGSPLIAANRLTLCEIHKRTTCL